MAYALLTGALLLSAVSGFAPSSPCTPGVSASRRRCSDSRRLEGMGRSRLVARGAVPTFAPSDEKLEPEKVVMDASWFLQFGMTPPDPPTTGGGAGFAGGGGGMKAKAKGKGKKGKSGAKTKAPPRADKKVHATKHANSRP